MGDWIWFAEGDPNRDAPLAARFFRRQFDVEKGELRGAVLRVAADDRFTAWINGREIGSGTDWSNPTKLNATAALAAGSQYAGDPRPETCRGR